MIHWPRNAWGLSESCILVSILVLTSLRILQRWSDLNIATPWLFDTWGVRVFCSYIVVSKETTIEEPGARKPHVRVCGGALQGAFLLCDEVRGTYLRFRGKLNDCWNCRLNDQCVQNKASKRGCQVLIRDEGRKCASKLYLMKQKIDSEEGNTVDVCGQ